MTLSSRCALLFLAQIATDDDNDMCKKVSNRNAQDICIQRLCSVDSPVMHSTKPPQSRPTQQALSPPSTVGEFSSSAPSSSSSSSSSSPPPPSIGSPTRPARTTRSGRKKTKSNTAGHELQLKLQQRKKRKELHDKAELIKSLDNSPVNDRQLLVLRMVYDEITMYPIEPWIVLLAIIIRRAIKQVKNWFSNERQKRGGGPVISTQTKTGDKLRLRPSALDLNEEWSDEFFQEVVMIHNYRVLCNSRWQAGRALSDTSSNFEL